MCEFKNGFVERFEEIVRWVRTESYIDGRRCERAE